MKKSKHVSLGWLVLVRDSSTEAWRDSGEGPFTTGEAAEAFVEAEVGADHIIVEMYSFPRNGATGAKVELRNPSVYCVECGAEQETDCICDELNFAQESECTCADHNKI